EAHQEDDDRDGLHVPAWRTRVDKWNWTVISRRTDNQSGSLLCEFRVAAAPARHPVAMSREEHARPALRTVRSLPGDPIAIDFVEHPLEAGRPLLLLRLGHHFASFFLPSVFFSGFFSSFFSSFF